MSLSDSNDRVPEAQDMDALLAKVADPRVLQLIILPTEHCNFRCTYCYEDFKIGHMTPETVTAVSRWIQTRAPELSRLEISWFGGEPTLALPTILKLTILGREALNLSRQPRTFFRSGMTTNGYRLTTDAFYQLVSAGVTEYQITLDGPKAIHDKRRLRADGKGTFDVIWANLLSMAERADKLPRDVRIELRLHYDGTSTDEVEVLVEQICRQLLPSGIFHVKFHELERLGGARDNEIVLPRSRDHQRVRELSEAMASAQGLYRSHVAVDVDNYVCYAAKANAFVVRADGRLGKCTVALNDPRNDVGRLNPDGTIAWNEGRIGPWLRGLELRDPAVLACPLDGMGGFLAEELRRFKPAELAR